MFRYKRIVEIKLDVIKFLKGERKDIFLIKMRFPFEMPKEDIEDIKNRINSILDDLKKYL